MVVGEKLLVVKTVVQRFKVLLFCTSVKVFVCSCWFWYEFAVIIFRWHHLDLRP